MENKITEVEKMYENTRVYDFRYDCDVSFSDGDFGRVTNCSKGEIKDYCTDKKYFKGAKVINVRHLYPPFTPEKQLELIKWLIKYDELHADFNDNEYGCATLNYSGKYKKCFEESLASVINNELWQDLTESEQEQIRSILNG